MAGAYAYTGYATLGYPDYRDTESGRMLVAEPGGSYDIAAIDGVAPVPPSDGRWQGGETGRTSSGPPPPPPAVPAPPPVPELPGGEA